MGKIDAYKRLNDTEDEFRENVTIHELISAQARINPHNIAVIDYDRKITYEELEKKSDYIADILLESGVEVGQPIAVLLDRSIELIISIVAILKCGGVYVPIDISYPELRIKYIIEDTACKTVILPSSKHELPGGIEMDDKTVLYMEQVMDTLNNSSAPGRERTRSLMLEKNNQICDSDLAYILYTSGTTGKPKGVMVTHKAVINTLFWMSDKFEIGLQDIIAHKTSISFTDSIWEIFCPLLNGAKISIAKDCDVKDPRKLYFWLRDHDITITQFVPSILKVFLDFIEVNRIENPLPKLIWIFNGGEHINVHLARKWNSLFCTAKIANIYGMTESAIYATCFIIEKQLDDHLDSISIGKPIANTKVYILNSHNELCDIGEKGEICISGIGLARGYWNKPDLTKVKFDSSIIGFQTIYRTGDIGALCDDGNIGYYGRMDNQVKIRGNRVEISEVEKNILQFEEIDQVAVIHKKDNFDENVLICFLTNHEVDITELKAFLSKSLPDYMIPQQFIMIDRLPLTINNKIDRDQLKSLKVNHQDILMNTDHNKLRSEIVQIWGKLLDLSYIGLNDDFFEIGGNSIAAARLQISLEKIGITIDHDTIYAHNTINKLTEYIRKNNLYERIS